MNQTIEDSTYLRGVGARLSVSPKRERSLFLRSFTSYEGRTTCHRHHTGWCSGTSA